MLDAKPFPGLASADSTAGASLVADEDDDDEDGVLDSRQSSQVPTEDTRSLTFKVEQASAQLHVSAAGPLRLLCGEKPTMHCSPTVSSQGHVRVVLQGLRASSLPNDAWVHIQAGKRKTSLSFTVISIAWLNHKNQALDLSASALGISHHVTNDESLPRDGGYFASSSDPENFRIEIVDPRISANTLAISLQSVAPSLTRSHSELQNVTLTRPKAGLPFRSQYIRLVGDDMDFNAPGVEAQVLTVGLRDHVRVRYAQAHSYISQSTRVARPGWDPSLRAAHQASLRFRILRQTPQGDAVIGASDEQALRMARNQIMIANEIWLQCFIHFGEPEAADIALVDPPSSTLLAIADGDGLPAKGGGTIRFMANGKVVGPINTQSQATPMQTAFSIAHALQKMGFVAHVTENPKTEYGAGSSADVLVLDAQHGWVSLQQETSHPLTTDARQSLKIGEVDLNDGLMEFSNMNAASGSLEERTLVKALSDNNPQTIDVFIVNYFTAQTRQGEAFIEANGGPMINTLILDRNGLRQQRLAWTQAHEIGHVLLNQPYHPDHVGPDRPWLLMDADNSMGLITGPKRLRYEECARAKIESGPESVPALLKPYVPSPSDDAYASTKTRSATPASAPTQSYR